MEKMMDKEWASIIAAIITASATVFVGLNHTNLSFPMNNSIDNEANSQKDNLLPTISGLTSDKPDPQYAGTTIQWICSAYDHENDPISYKFLLNGTDETGWTKNNTWIWRTNTNEMGTSQIDVWIRDGKHADLNNFDDHKSIKFTIASKPQAMISIAKILTKDLEGPSSQASPSQAYLSDKHTYKSTFESLKYDSYADMKIGNRGYEKGVQLGDLTHYVPSTPKYHYAYFDLNEEYSRLTGLIGLDDKTTYERNVTVYICFDDDEVIKMYNLVPGNLPTSIDINVSGVKRLAIKEPASGYIYIDLIDMNLQ